MKLMSWMMIMLCCALAFTPVRAQQSGSSASSSSNVTVNIDQGRRGGDRGGYGRGDRGRSYYRERRPGWRYESGRGWYDPSAAIGGAIGGWLWKQWNQPQEPPQPVRDAAWCAHRYKSYDWYTRTYLGYDGLRHGCP